MLDPSDAPVWQPLLDLAPEHVEEFMWMCEVELEDGVRLHAYKHWWTRRYIHLTLDGRAFAYEDVDGCERVDDFRPYREAAPGWLLEQALPSGQQLAEWRLLLERARQDSNL